MGVIGESDQALDPNTKLEKIQREQISQEWNKHNPVCGKLYHKQNPRILKKKDWRRNRLE